MTRFFSLVFAFWLPGCALFSKSVRPAAVGAELALCEEKKTLAEWQECCRSVASRYPNADGSPRDPSLCEVE